MTSCLVRSTPERVVLVRALARDIVLYSQQDALLSQCLSPSTRLYKWVPAKLMLGVTLRWTNILSREAATETGISDLISHLARM